MKPFSIKLGARSSVMVTTAAVALGCVTTQALALTAANTVITNQATATYEDANGNLFTAQSNVAEVTVQQVYAGNLSRNLVKTGAAGQAVYTTHVLTNTGNGEDTYSISVAQMATGDGANFDVLNVYVDGNQNGIADPGERLIANASGTTGTITLDANSNATANLIIEAKVPSSAADDLQIGSILTAKPVDATHGDVADTSAEIKNAAGTVVSDVDPTDGAGTNHTLVTVTSDAVLEINKAAVHNEVDKTFTYTITAQNNGIIDAANVILYDQIPVVWYDKNNDGIVNTAATHPLYPNAVVAATVTAATEELVRLAIVGTPTSAGFVNTGDSAAQNASFNETTDGFAVDLNGDGSVGTAAWSIWAKDAALPSGTSVSMSFVVSYDPDLMEAVANNADVPDTVSGTNTPPAIDSNILNSAKIIGDVDGAGTKTPIALESNVVTVNASAFYAVEANDTGDGAVDAINDGKDDDGALNDVQVVNTASSGETVIFTVDVINTGNVQEPKDLVIDTGGATPFPAGTIFQLWNSTGTIQLTDTDGSGTNNTPPIAQNESYSVIVKAILPATVPAASTGPYNATFIANTTGEPDLDLTDGTGTQSNVTLRLTTITAGGPDLSNTVPTGTDNQDAYAVGGNTPVTTINGTLGKTVDFPLYVQNESGKLDTYQLYAGASWNGAATLSSLGALHDGWSVAFYEDANDDGTPDGPAVTVTSAIVGGSYAKIIARVSIPSDSTKALLSFTTADTDANGTAAMVNGNGDTDGDYPIIFMARSVATDVADVKMDAVDVLESSEFLLEGDRSATLLPGGSVTTDHTATNTGNVPNVISLSVDDGAVLTGEVIRVDTDGDGISDTPLGAVSIGDTVYILKADGSLAAVTTVDNNGSVGIPLLSGEIIPFTVTSSVSTTALNGDIFINTITGVDAGGVTQTQNVILTAVITNLRLSKTASFNADCDSASMTLTPQGAFQKTGHAVAPGACVIWQVVATNVGPEPLEKLVIEDTTPLFTSYVAGTMRYCVGDAFLGAENDTAEADCSFLNAETASVGSIVGSDLIFAFTGVTALGDTAGTPAGSDLDPGSAVTIRFATQVE